MKKSAYTQRKIVSLLLTLVMILSAIPLAGISAFALTSGNFEYRVLDDGTAEITNGIYLGDTQVLEIPSKLGKYTVTRIGDWAFENCASLTSVTIPDSVIYIGEHAFEDCDSLQKVKIPDSVTGIGSCPFYGCGSLKYITVDENNKVFSSQGGALFDKNKTRLIQYPIGDTATDYTVPGSVKTIDEYAFYSSILTSVEIPDSVTDIGCGAFYGCERLYAIYIYNKECDIYNSNVTIPSGVKIYGYTGSTAEEYANKYRNRFVALDDIDDTQYFKYKVLSDGTAEITKYTGAATVLDIPSTLGKYTVTSIGYSAFSNCASLTSVTIPDTVTSIGTNAFAGCFSLVSAIIPEGITVIPRAMFSHCYSLANINIPDGVTVIDGYAFYYCENLSYVTLPDSVISIGNSAFRYCSFSSITIPESVTTIGNFVFYDCENLTSVTIPASVESIDICAFGSCESLTNIYVDENNEYYSSLDGVLFNKDQTEIVQYPIGNEREAYTMPDSVITVGRYCFKDSAILKDVTISENAEIIDFNAFDGSTGITSIIIPESVEYIEPSAFTDCVNLSDIYILGRECDIDGNYTLPLKTTVHGYPDSYVEDYATARGIKFVPFIPYINVTATVDGEEYDGEYTAEEIVITAETYADIYYSIDSGEWIKLEGNSINAADGVHTYEFKAVDHYVESEITSVATKREANTPVLSVEVTGTLGEWTKDNVSFKLSAENTDSGVTYYYSVNGTDWTEIKGNTLTVSENTNAQYVFKCVNGVGNESEISQQYTVMIDKDIPSGFLVEMQNEDDAVIIKISAGDSTNIAKYQYSVNGGEWLDVDGDSITFTEPGEYSVSIRAVSVSDVIFEKVTLTFTIDEPVVDDPEPDELLGDVNNDGKITLIDAKWILQYIAGTRQFDDRQKRVADVNGDGKISAIDAKWVLQIVAGSRDAETLELIK